MYYIAFGFGSILANQTVHVVYILSCDVLQIVTVLQQTKLKLIFT